MQAESEMGMSILKIQKLSLHSFSLFLSLTLFRIKYYNLSNLCTTGYLKVAFVLISLFVAVIVALWLLLLQPHVAARTWRLAKIKTESELKMNYAEMNAKLLSQSEIYKPHRHAHILTTLFSFSLPISRSPFFSHTTKPVFIFKTSNTRVNTWI